MSNPPAWPLRQLHRGLALRAVNRTRAEALASSVELALDPWRRLRGLLGRDHLASGEGLLLRPCRSVHTILMRFTIDVLFLDEEGVIVGLESNLRPNRFSGYYGGALATLELPAGGAALARTSVGDRVAFVERQ